MSNKAFTIGSDPEFFIIDQNTAKPLKASQFTGGTKDDVEEMGDDFNVHADNVMMELNLPPSVSKEAFVKNILTGKTKLQDILFPHTLVTVPSMHFPKNLLLSKDDWEIGCDPDKSAYTMQNNPTIELKTGMRFAGGHVHIGLPEDMIEIDTIISIIKALDYLFMDMVIREDSDSNRKEIYGTPGRFRFKDYGLEYRSLSNFWLRRVVSIKRVYDIVEEAVNNHQKYSTPENEKIVFKYFQTTQGKEKTKVEKSTIQRLKLTKN